MTTRDWSYYGLPAKVVYCKRCVMSNQRPTSTPEARNDAGHQKKSVMHIDQDGICDACRYAERKNTIDWEARERELVALLDKHRRSDGGYEALVPGSGGKDSAYASHVLKYKYGMKVLTCTWPPHIYTEIGWKNFRNWIDVGGFDNVTFNPNGRVHRLLTRLAFENLLHPYQTFVLGQKYMPPKIALQHKIPLVFYGENEAEYGNAIADNSDSLRDRAYYTADHMSDIYLAGTPVSSITRLHGLTPGDLSAYLPLSVEEVERGNLDVRYLGYYLKWTPQECYYYACEHTGFDANTYRTEGTFSKYVGLDDCFEGFHFYTAYIKFGLGRASADASQEIRNKHLLRDEGVALVRKFDGEFPQRYFKEVLEYMGMDEDVFWGLINGARSPHLWEKGGGEWQLRHPVWEP